jgi:hypothetical protein
MDKTKIREFHYITHVDNLPSIAIHGILSHNLASGVAHKDLSSTQVQGKRQNKKIPGGNLLHDYANLYFDARNPMLFTLISNNSIDSICVLSIIPGILDLPNCIISDRNAASDYARFMDATQGCRIIDETKTFAKYWTSEDIFIEMELKSCKCAELLVPNRVDIGLIQYIYVANDSTKMKIPNINSNIPILVNMDLFFNKG